MESTSQLAPEGNLSVAISNAVVQCTREYTGRGPTKARATVTPHMIVVAMEDSLTKGERSLVSNGKGEMVLDIRRCFQTTMREDMISRIEDLTGRTVIAFMSDNHIDPDMAVEVFMLAPLGAGELRSVDPA